MTTVLDAESPVRCNGADCIPVLDSEKYYSLKEDQVVFFKTYTGIEDDEELKRHIIKVQTDAYAVSSVIFPEIV